MLNHRFFFESCRNSVSNSEIALNFERNSTHSNQVTTKSQTPSLAMPARKTAVTPEGHTDDEFDSPSQQFVPVGLKNSIDEVVRCFIFTFTVVPWMLNIRFKERLRRERTKVRQEIGRDFSKDVSQLKTRINQHYGTQKTKRYV
jgi:hypothetical protein